MTLTVKNGSPRAKAFPVVGGIVTVKPGETRTLDNARELRSDQIKALKADGVELSSGAEKTEPKEKAKKTAKPKGDDGKE